ncbi:hypothetical protein DFH08DRAFT_820252 [Mycena albidolilacea]|uniref:Uncharacterized protein n=1 Tax=Mycena albidolilacea TaxID=1033008 RepID=A0AAD7EE96_9AGAR|nr:hypothetical protein DFH08DRAFT_820252 [Mycena albidolilacea]
MFSGNQGFTVNGRTFTSVTNQYPTSVPSGGSALLLSFYIDLRRQIQVDSGMGVVGCQCERVCVRRVYCAKVEGRRSKFTVVMYEGNGTAEEWWCNIGKDASVRHPNIIQIYGAASSGSVHATLYHDGHLLNLVCQKRVDFSVGIFSPLLKLLTPGRQQATMCIPHFNGICWSRTGMTTQHGYVAPPVSSVKSSYHPVHPSKTSTITLREYCCHTEHPVLWIWSSWSLNL